MAGRFLDHDKFCRAFLQYRNTPPRKDKQYLQLRSFMVAIPRIPFLPTVAQFLVKPEWQRQAEVEQQAKTTQESITTYYNAHAHPLTEIGIGSNVAYPTSLYHSVKLWTYVAIYGIVTH